MLAGVASSSRSAIGRAIQHGASCGSRRYLSRPVNKLDDSDLTDLPAPFATAKAKQRFLKARDAKRRAEGRRSAPQDEKSDPPPFRSERAALKEDGERTESSLWSHAGTSRSNSSLARPHKDSLDAIPPRPDPPTARRTADPLSLVGDKRGRVAYQSGKTPQSREQQAFFRNPEAEVVGGDAAQLGIEDESEQLQLSPGQVVEGRRFNDPHLGLILAPIVIRGRQRYIVLRSTGELWPMGAGDIAYVFPPETIPRRVAERCWHPDLLNNWAKGENVSDVRLPNVDGAVVAQAQREATVQLRQLRRKLEDVMGELVAAGGGDPAAVMWDAAAPNGEVNEERAVLTAAEGAAGLLGKKAAGGVDALTAYAAHSALMSRPDLVWADEKEMWSSGKFLVRSRAEVGRIQQVSKWISRSSPEGVKIIRDFVARANAILAARKINDPAHDATTQPWTDNERTIISVLVQRLYETRLIQRSKSQAVMLRILKEIDDYKDQELNEMLLAQFLVDLGVMHVNESLSVSAGTETTRREWALGGSPRGTDTLLKGDELESLREDFTSHKVYVIDDPTAKELDDGISLQKCNDGAVWIHVHIADPTLLIPPENDLAVRASFMGSSMYFADGTIPLLPIPEVMRELSLGAGGGEGGAQGVMTFSAKMSPEGELLDHHVRLGRINSPRLISYEAVDQALGFARPPPSRPFGVLANGLRSAETPISLPPSPSPSELDDLKLLQGLARTMRTKRSRYGGLEFSRPEALISLVGELASSPNLFDHAHIPRAPLPLSDPIQIGYGVVESQYAGVNANKIVAEMMILAGRVAARWCSERSVPVAFRGQRPPVVMELLDRASMSLEDVMARRRADDCQIDLYELLRANLQINPTVLSRDPIEHWGTGIPAGEGYLRVTSPLRRYEDLLWHWQIKAWIARQAGLPWSKGVPAGDILPLAQDLERHTKAAKRLGINKDKYWQHRLILERLTGPILPQGWQSAPGADNTIVDLRQPIAGRIASLSKDDVAVALTDVMIPQLGVLALLTHSPRTRFEIGQEVMVKIDRVKQWPSAIEVVLAKP